MSRARDMHPAAAGQNEKFPHFCPPRPRARPRLPQQLAPIPDLTVFGIGSLSQPGPPHGCSLEASWLTTLAINCGCALI